MPSWSSKDKENICGLLDKYGAAAVLNNTTIYQIVFIEEMIMSSFWFVLRKEEKFINRFLIVY